MYTLYYSPGTCALATHVVLNELKQSVDAIDRANVRDFREISPTNSVPVLRDGDLQLTEGVAVLLHLLEKHENALLPTDGPERSRALEAMLFANATVHPAYGRMFYAANAIADEAERSSYMEKAAASINELWRIIDGQIGEGTFVAGDQLSPADILLAVYSDWGQYFPVDIVLGKNTERMIRAVKERQSYVDAVAAQSV